MKRSFLILVLFAALPAVVLAARMPRGASKRPPQIRPQRPERPARVAKPDPADTIERLGRLHPADRERALASLPDKKQKEIAGRLNAIDSWNPADRVGLLNRYRNFESLPPDQKDHVRNALRQFGKLPEPRRIAVAAELDQIDRLSPTDRAHHLNSDEYRSRFNSQERQIIENTPSSRLK